MLALSAASSESMCASRWTRSPFATAEGTHAAGKKLATPSVANEPTSPPRQATITIVAADGPRLAPVDSRLADVGALCGATSCAEGGTPSLLFVSIRRAFRTLTLGEVGD
jgi:hypothetical protein